jgi:uncharacterized protein (DUF736 family)
MSKFEQKDGSGALFKNHDKESENHPDYRGSIKIGGTEYWLNAWLKESAKGTKYMSLSAQPKQERTEKPAKQPAAEFVDDSDIPF